MEDQEVALGPEDFALERHVAYFKKLMKALPAPYKSMDTNRLTLLYFSVSGLDLLGKVGEIDKEHVISYIYSLQSNLPDNGGFYGYPKVQFDSPEEDRLHNQPHIANTYVALNMLIILGDDLSRVDRSAVAHSLRKWQLEDGSFCCVHGLSSLDSESDMRFVYCAACICYVLDLWEAVDVDGMYRFILSAQSYDKAFGMGPHTEAHGGCTYCALASLAMMGRLDDLRGRDSVVDWCVKRQQGGFQGRVEKAMDSCYSFWVGASLQLLGFAEFVHGPQCAAFLKRCESRATGGFQKFPEVAGPDILHSYFSICGLSLCGLLQPLNARLNISERAYTSVAHRCRQASGHPPAAIPAPRPLAPTPAQAKGGEGGPCGGWRAAALAAAAAVLLALAQRPWEAWPPKT